MTDRHQGYFAGNQSPDKGRNKARKRAKRKALAIEIAKEVVRLMGAKGKRESSR